MRQARRHVLAAEVEASSGPRLRELPERSSTAPESSTRTARFHLTTRHQEQAGAANPWAALRHSRWHCSKLTRAELRRSPPILTSLGTLVLLPARCSMV